MNWLEAIRQIRPTSRFFLAGSSEAFGDTGADVACETTPFRPRSPYGIAKAAATQMTAMYREAHGLFACTGILFNHESPLRTAAFVTRKVTDAAIRISKGSDERLPLGDLAVRRDWGWAPEYVDAFHQMLQQINAEDFVIATGRPITLQEFVEAVFNALGLDWRDYVDFDPALRRPNEPRAILANPKKSQDKLGWTAATSGTDVAYRLVQEHEDMFQAKSIELS